MDFVVPGENQGDFLPRIQRLGEAMQEKNKAFRSRIANKHSSERHVGIDLDESGLCSRSLRNDRALSESAGAEHGASCDSGEHPDEWAHGR